MFVPHILGISTGVEVIIYTVLSFAFQLLAGFFGAKSGAKKNSSNDLGGK